MGRTTDDDDDLSSYVAFDHNVNGLVSTQRITELGETPMLFETLAMVPDGRGKWDPRRWRRSSLQEAEKCHAQCLLALNAGDPFPDDRFA